MVCFMCQLAADAQLFYVLSGKVDCADLTKCKAFNIVLFVVNFLNYFLV